MLERGLGLVLGVSRQVDLAVLADDRAVRPDEDRGIEAPTLGRELGIAEVEADPQLFGLVEQGLRLLRRNAFFKVLRIDVGLVLHPPARKEGGERELGKDDELRAHAVRFPQQVHESFHGDGARIRLVERPELGGGDLQVSSH
jgi:hypothetical protein